MISGRNCRHLNREAVDIEGLGGEYSPAYLTIRWFLRHNPQRPVQRPQDSEKQKEHYSGKNRRHTRKHITGTTRKKRVIVLTPARPGKLHDKRQLDENLVDYIPDEVRIEADLGFQGLHNEFENIHLPHKKPRGKELTEQHKQENRDFSRQRVKCEHAHAGIKRYQATSSLYRNRVPDFDDRLMLTAAGLWNFYLDAA